MFSMSRYNFENCLENVSVPFCENSAKTMDLEDQVLGKGVLQVLCKMKKQAHFSYIFFNFEI